MPLNESMNLCCFCCIFQFPHVRLPSPIANIIADCVVEKHCVLGDHPDGLTELPQWNLADILFIEEDLPGFGFDQPEKEANYGTFARSGFADLKKKFLFRFYFNFTNANVWPASMRNERSWRIWLWGE